MNFLISIYLCCLFLYWHVNSQDLTDPKYRKYPECLLAEDSGFCTPVTRYGVVLPTEANRDEPGTCTNFSYYGEGGTRGFASFQDCVYACTKGPLTDLIQVGK
uniref:BPTI/Kunitz inhibitor domain-containing protein n=1 Tax=Papilio polytes TaxID=76194 RepID=I4DMG9_PAPPL|nr:uncharacterized protein LOC106106597 precursor [Papilio polytes]BAM19109.1 unknown secreted protein [Papilio polytes]